MYGKEVGYVYYDEPFDWTSKFKGADCVGEHTQKGAVNIYTPPGAESLCMFMAHLTHTDSPPSLRRGYSILCRGG